jgi:hypothetical protein
MSFFSWLRHRTSTHARQRLAQRRAAAPRFRPQLEALENRIVPSFSSPLSIPVQSQGLIGNNGNLVAADLTGNGKTDFVVGVGAGVEVLIQGTKAGTISQWSHVFFGTNYLVNSIAVGDINNDGKPDIVVAENSGDSASFGVPGIISVLLGNGQGGFGLPVDFGQDTETNRVALADLNGDGLLDIVTDNSVLLNQGYAPGLGWATQNYNFGAANGLALGDLNGDGRPDIVAMGNGNQIQVWLNNGAGGFTAGQVIGGIGAVSPAPFDDNGAALGDVNGDGKLDLVMANGTSNSVSVFAGSGDGTFNTTTAQTYAVGGAAYAVALGDFNGDGKPDIVTTGAEMDVLLNNGDGTYGPAQKVGPAGSSVVVADFNGDGFPDLAQLDGSGASIDVLLNTTGGAGGSGGKHHHK